jgi:N-acetylmuramoyl-L-alanine amidase
MKKLLLLFLSFLIFIFLAFSLCGCNMFSPEDIVFSDAEYVYDGTEKVLISPTLIPEKYSIAYENNSATEAGKYLCRAVIYNKKNGSIECEKYATLTILPAEYDMTGVEFSDATVDFDGALHSLEISGVLPTGVSVSYSENAFCDAGTYNVTASFTSDNKNYKSIESKSATLTISPIEAPVTLTLADGELHSLSLPVVTSDLAGQVIFCEGQKLTPGEKEYYFDFIPESKNYVKKSNIPLKINVSATIKYYDGDKLLQTEYVKTGASPSCPVLQSYEKDDVFYRFSHWEDGTKKKVDASTKPSDDLSLFAVFSTENKMSVELVYKDGGTEKFGFYPSLLPLSLPIPSGDFSGWHESRFFTSKKHLSITDSSLSGKKLYALYTPSVTLADNETEKKPSYDTESITVSKSQLYYGSLIAANAELSSSVDKSMLASLYGKTPNVKLSSSSHLLSAEALDALNAMGTEYNKLFGAHLLVTQSFSDFCADALCGNSVYLKHISGSTVSDIDKVARAKSFLSERAAEFGFVLRYTDEHSGSTGVGGDGFSHYYRYVGTPHALFMEAHGLSLEEYLHYIKRYSDTHLYVSTPDTEYEIYYVPCNSEKTVIKVPKNEKYVISGNNFDGFIITVEREKYTRKLDFLVCVDAGHGGHDGGANGGESKINLAVAHLLCAECEKQGFDVIMTRKDDTFVSLSDRCVIANTAKADIFVSIHCNSATSTAANGTEVYYYAGEKSISLAKSVYQNMMSLVPLTSRGVKYGNYQVTRETNMPAILCELAFLSNTSDYKMLHDEATQASWAKAICKGICEYYGVEYIE